MVYGMPQLEFIWPFDLKGFMVKNQISNLIPNPSFDHNSCILSLYKQQGNFR